MTKNSKCYAKKLNFFKILLVAQLSIFIFVYNHIKLTILYKVTLLSQKTNEKNSYLTLNDTG